MPRFPLTKVHAAAAEGRVVLGGPRYKERLLPLLGEYVRMITFTEAVLQELRANDFMSSKSYEGVDHDEYGVAISATLQERFAIEGFETWYVKFTVETDASGEAVLMASLHGAEGPLKRVGGTLQVRFCRRES